MSIQVDTRGPVTVLTVHREQVRNAYDPPTLRVLAEELLACRQDGAKAAVLTGSGTASFSSGMDLKAMRAAEPGQVEQAVQAFRRAVDDPDRVPLIAAVNGPATGGGFETVLRCDLVVAAEHATFGLPEVQRGIVPGGGATLLPARVPMAVAQELAIVGEPISAGRAYELGLVNRVVPGPHVLETALSLARRIAANGPFAVRRTRALLWLTLNEGAGPSWAETARSTQVPELRAEMEEGVEAFLEKRLPRW